MAKPKSPRPNQPPSPSLNDEPRLESTTWDECARIDYCWRIIQRFDNYINATNTKAAIVLTFNSFVLGTIVLKCGEILEVISSNKIAMGIAVLLILSSAIASTASLWFALRVLVPVLTSPKEPNRYHSLLFFCHVAEFSKSESYAEAIRDRTTALAADDLAQQAHTLAKIVEGKFEKLAWSAWLILYVQLPLICCLIATTAITILVATVNGGQQ